MTTSKSTPKTPAIPAGQKAKADKTVLSSDGLRYKNKSAGSPFSSSNFSTMTSSMSCFKCGRHRRPEDMETKRLFGALQKICKGGCAPKE